MILRRLLYLQKSSARLASRRALSSSVTVRHDGAAPNSSTAYEYKYADKLTAKMNEKGVESLDALKASVEKLKPEPVGVPFKPVEASTTSTSASADGASKPIFTLPKRSDSSPVVPLSSFLNVSKIMSSPHTSEQISALWVLYHSSRSGGTGRGYLSAPIPKDIFEDMAARGKKYPVFVLPLPRTIDGETKEDGTQEETQATEFYFMQWAFHAPPEPPSVLTNLDPLEKAFAAASASVPSPSPTSSTSTSPPLPPIATILFTPLEEYKLRASYATPRLIITLYPDLIHTHNLALLRGEISPSEHNPQNFTMSQTDAQLLAMAFQKFYVKGESGESRAAGELLQVFHEKPEEFEYEKLIKLGRSGL